MLIGVRMILASTGAMEPIFVTNINSMRDPSFLPSHRESIVGIDEVLLNPLPESLINLAAYLVYSLIGRVSISRAATAESCVRI